MSRDASLRQRSGQRRYNFAEHGNSNQGSKQGKFIIKNNLAQHWNPCWGDGVTVIRPYPAKSIEQGVTWDPYRYSAEGNQFGDWIRRYDAVRNFGDPGVTFIIADPADPTREDPQRLPAWELFNAIDKAVSSGQEQQGWAGLLRGGRNRGAVLSRPSEVYLIQGAIMQHKTELFSSPRGFGDDKPLMLELSSNAGVSMLTELNRLNENSGAPEGDWEHMFVNGDAVSLDYGRFITFYKLADGDPRQRQQQQAGGWNSAGQQATGARQADPIGYGCYLEPTFNGIPANLRQFESMIQNKVQMWDDILWFPTVEEQAHLIADKFPPDVILYAWRDHPDWIPETIRNRAVAHHAVNAPAGGWQQGWGQPGQQGMGVPPAGGFGAPPAGGFGVPTGQPQPGFGAPVPQAGFGGQQLPQQQFPPQQFQQPLPATQPPYQQPQQQFAPPQQQIPGGFAPQMPMAPVGQPQQPVFGQPQAGQPAFSQPPAGQPTFGQPGVGQQFPAGPTGGPPPALPPVGFQQPQQYQPPQQQAYQPPQQQAYQPPQQAYQPPQQAYQPPQQPNPMAWAGQGNTAAPASGAPPVGMMPQGGVFTQPTTQMPMQTAQPVSPMGQTPGGFAQPGTPQGLPQGIPTGGYTQPANMAPPNMAPPNMSPPVGATQPLSRSALALQAAQAAMATQPGQVPQQ